MSPPCLAKAGDSVLKHWIPVHRIKPQPCDISKQCWSPTSKYEEMPGKETRSNDAACVCVWPTGCQTDRGRDDSWRSTPTNTHTSKLCWCVCVNISLSSAAGLSILGHKVSVQFSTYWIVQIRSQLTVSYWYSDNVRSTVTFSFYP